MDVWLLVRAFSDSRATAWKHGDIVEVRPGGFTEWGTQECLPKFYRVKVTGLSAAFRVIKVRLESADVTINVGTGMVVARNRVRQYGIRIAEVPTGVRTTLQTVGELTVTKAQIVNVIKDNANVLASLD